MGALEARARGSGEDQGFGQECDCAPAQSLLVEAADLLGEALEQMLAPVRRLRAGVAGPSSRPRPTSSIRVSASRIEGVARSLANRCELTLEAWRAMLRGLHNELRSRLRRLVRHREDSELARSMSACTATISIRPSRS